jgi:ankyrin repeat protein
MVKRILDAETIVNAEPAHNHGYTALSAAAEAGNVRIVKRLPQAGVDVSITSGNKHWNALQIANFHGHAEVVILLQDAGTQGQIN